MMSRWLLLTVVLAAGCSGVQPVPVGDTAPFTAVIVFEWEVPHAVSAGSTGEARAEPPGGGPELAIAQETATARPVDASRQVSPDWVEQEILAGLKQYQVFSHLVPATAGEMETKAQEVKADLIVRIRIGKLVEWEDSSRKVLVGLGILDTAVWIMTAIGSWWIPDVEFSTDSEVEVSWRRPRPSEEKPRKKLATSRDPATELPYTDTERLTTGDYRVSFWDRAKLWRYPWPYLMTILIPPVLVPVHDRTEVDTALVTLAIEDLKRDIARKLMSGTLRSGGMPFLFRLEAPLNGADCEGDSVTIQFRYSVEPGFEKQHAAEGLMALRVDVKPEGQDHYRSLRELNRDELMDLNEKIGSKDSFAIDVDGLEPGMNLIRFSAQTGPGRQWITNTVAISGR